MFFSSFGNNLKIWVLLIFLKICSALKTPKKRGENSAWRVREAFQNRQSFESPLKEMACRGFQVGCGVNHYWWQKDWKKSRDTFLC